MDLRRDDFLFCGDDDVEPIEDYKPGGYHPVTLGDTFFNTQSIESSSYRVLHKLGHGSYSTVWLAKDLTHGNRPVALKIIVASLTERSHEIKLLQWLASQSSNQNGRRHVVNLLDYFQIQGPNESGLVRKYRKMLSHQAMIGLAYLHELGICHGDLHFGNLAITIPTTIFEERFWNCLTCPESTPIVHEDPQQNTKSFPSYAVPPVALLNGRVLHMKGEQLMKGDLKIIDFGNAFRKDGLKIPSNTPRIICSPEVRFYELSCGEVDSDWDLRSDIWSLACTIYEISTEQYLFYAMSGVDGIFEQITTLDGPLPSRWAPYTKAITGSDKNVQHVNRSWEEKRRQYFTYDQSTNNTQVREDDSAQFIDLLRKMLRIEAHLRMAPADLVQHSWFKNLQPL